MVSQCLDHGWLRLMTHQTMTYLQHDAIIDNSVNVHIL